MKTSLSEKQRCHAHLHFFFQNTLYFLFTHPLCHSVSSLTVQLSYPLENKGMLLHNILP